MLSLLIRLYLPSCNTVASRARGFLFLLGVGKQFFFSQFCLLSYIIYIPLQVVQSVSAIEDLTRQWNYLSLFKRKGDDISFKKDRCSKEFIIAALFLTRRAPNMDVVGRTFKPLWWSQNGFKITNEGDHKVLFVFDKEEEVEKILSSRPWSFDKSLVLLQRYDRHIALDDLSFDKVSFWVQVHNIPISYRNRSVAEDICESIGLVNRSTDVSECECGNYIRVRVTLNVFQPLCRGRIIRLEKDKKLWVNFKYKQLPNLCYWCGCLDQGDKECDL